MSDFLTGLLDRADVAPPAPIAPRSLSRFETPLREQVFEPSHMETPISTLFSAEPNLHSSESQAASFDHLNHPIDRSNHSPGDDSEANVGDASHGRWMDSRASTAAHHTVMATQEGSAASLGWRDQLQALNDRLDQWGGRPQPVNTAEPASPPSRGLEPTVPPAHISPPPIQPPRASSIEAETGNRDRRMTTPPSVQPPAVAPVPRSDHREEFGAKAAVQTVQTVRMAERTQYPLGGPQVAPVARVQSELLSGMQPPAPTVSISIGRIVVRTEKKDRSTGRPPTTPHASLPTVSAIDAYVRKRSAGGAT